MKITIFSTGRKSLNQVKVDENRDRFYRRTDGRRRNSTVVSHATAICAYLLSYCEIEVKMRNKAENILPWKRNPEW